MKTTDEQILDLVAAGFVLPKGTELLGSDLAIKCEAFTEVDTRQNFSAILLRKQQAHDLCAMEFARQAYPAKDTWNGTALERCDDAMADGDSAAAIKALWEGVCKCTTKKNA